MTPAEILHLDAAKYATNRKNAYVAAMRLGKNAYVAAMKLGNADDMSEKELNSKWLAHYEGYREGYWVATGDTKYSTDPAKFFAD